MERRRSYWIELNALVPAVNEDEPLTRNTSVGENAAEWRWSAGMELPALHKGSLNVGFEAYGPSHHVHEFFCCKKSDEKNTITKPQRAEKHRFCLDAGYVNESQPENGLHIYHSSETKLYVAKSRQERWTNSCATDH